MRTTIRSVFLIAVLFVFAVIALPSSAEAETITEDSGIYTITYDEAVKDHEYVLTLVKGTSKKYSTTDADILYIDQKTAEDTEVTFEFPFNKADVAGQYTILLSSNDKKEGNEYALVLGIDINKASAGFSGTGTYSGKKIEPAVSLSVGDELLEQNKDYTVTYSNNILPGKAAIALMGTGKYKGTKNLDFDILLPKPASLTYKLYAYNAAKISWSKSTYASGYYVYYKKSSADDYTYLGATASTSYKKSKLSSGETYLFKVRPYRKISGVKYPAYSGNAAEKVSSAIYTLRKMDVPNVSKYSSSYVTVDWTEVPGATGYQIYRSRYSSKSFVKVKTVKAGSSSLNIKTTKNRTYYYKIRAYKYSTGTVYAPFSSVAKYNLK